MINHGHYYSCPVHLIGATNKFYYKFLPPTQEKYFTEESINYLRQVYNLLYPDYEIVKLEYFYQENRRILINAEEYITTQCRSKRSSAIVAHWPGVLGID